MEFQPSEHSYGYSLASTAGAPQARTSAAPVVVPAVLVGVLAIPAFVITPFILKAFVPKWSYGRRLTAGLGIGMAVGTTTLLIRTARGKG